MEDNAKPLTTLIRLIGERIAPALDAKKAPEGALFTGSNPLRFQGLVLALVPAMGVVPSTTPHL